MEDQIKELHQQILDIGSKIVKEKMKVKGANYDSIRDLQQQVDCKIEELDLLLIEIKDIENYESSKPF